MRSGSRTRRGPIALAAALALLGGLAPRRSRAEGGTGYVDPSYGRVDGDLSVVVGVGVAVASPGARAEGELRVRYLETAGAFAALEDGVLVGSPAAPRRTLVAGLELRPLFLFRWLQGHETRRARLDLAIDSIGLELGATFDQPEDGAFGARRGLQAGLGVEVPILEAASGPWVGVRGLLRWSEDALGRGAVVGPSDRQAVLAITLAWHQAFVAHIVDVGDEAPR